jgi:hypothetical protein
MNSKNILRTRIIVIILSLFILTTLFYLVVYIQSLAEV